MGLFSAAERLGAQSLDDLAVAVLDAADSPPPAPASAASQTLGDATMPVHWQVTHNNTWRWVQREEYVDGEWRLTGMTTPVHKATGRPKGGVDGYLDLADAPQEFRRRMSLLGGQSSEVGGDDSEVVLASAELVVDGDPADRDSVPADEDTPGPDAIRTRRARHGRPPSRWLRSLSADELSLWLQTVEPPEATVEGMTFAVHLTRDHGFAEDPIAGLTDEEQAKLHGAAHHGY